MYWIKLIRYPALSLLFKYNAPRLCFSVVGHGAGVTILEDACRQRRQHTKTGPWQPGPGACRSERCVNVYIVAAMYMFQNECICEKARFRLPQTLPEGEGQATALTD